MDLRLVLIGHEFSSLACEAVLFNIRIAIRNGLSTDYLRIPICGIRIIAELLYRIDLVLSVAVNFMLWPMLDACQEFVRGKLSAVKAN